MYFAPTMASIAEFAADLIELVLPDPRVERDCSSDRCSVFANAQSPSKHGFLPGAPSPASPRRGMARRRREPTLSSSVHRLRHRLVDIRSR
jgi:hypothetical protein